MRDNMTNSEQLKWVIQETGRQIVAPFLAAADQIYHEIPYRIRTGRLQNRKIRNLLENLTDDTLLDRLAIAPVHIPVIALDGPVSIPVRVKTIVRRLSIDGILAR